MHACMDASMCAELSIHIRMYIQIHMYIYTLPFKSLRLRPPTPEAYGKTADFGTLCIPAVRSDLTPAPHFCPRATAVRSLH